MSKRKICHLTSVHTPTDIRIFIKECSSLAGFGYDVHLVVANSKNDYKNGVKIHGIETSNGGRLSRMTKTVWNVYMKALEIDAEVYHFHDPELIPVGLMLKRKGKKVIYDVHEDVPRQIMSKYYIRKYYRKLISWLFERFENYAARKIDALVTATPHINRRFEEVGGNSVNINNYPILSELHVPEVKWDQKDRSVCYVGGITEIRGIHQMVEAIGNTNVQLLLAGEFNPDSLRDEIIELNGWNQVDELGQLNRDQVKTVLSKSMAGLVLFHPYPNHVDAQPNKLFEYMSAGLPIIASNFQLWEQLIYGNECGICVDPLKPEEISEAIQWIIDHPEEASLMGNNGRFAVETRYNWETEAKKLESVYKKLLER